MDETSINKCYYNEHSEQTATNYCFKCNKFLCETCSTSHFDANPHQIYLKLIFILNKIKLNDKKFNIILSIINEQKNSQCKSSFLRRS